MIDYIKEFPINEAAIPPKLKQLLSPIGSEDPEEMVEVTAFYEHDPYGNAKEYYHMTLLTVPEDSHVILRDYDICSSFGVSAFSTPICDKKGGLATMRRPPRSNHIVASWGNSSFYSYYLSEDFLMTMGLSPRCIGGDDQRVIFDDLSIPIIGVASGEISNAYNYVSKRNVHWKVRNDYLRHYLWARGHVGVKIFYYEGYVSQSEAYEQLLLANESYTDTPESGWYELWLQVNKEGILLQVSGAVIALGPEKCKSKDIYSLVWPGDSEPMTKDRARRLSGEMIYLRDSFLIKYEKNSAYSSTPYKYYDSFTCSPSYLSQWSFTECIRIGRNLIRVPLRELYKPKPDEEIIHAHSHAISRNDVKQFDLEYEHIVSKTYRLVDQIISLGNNLYNFAYIIDSHKYPPDKYTGFSAAIIQYSHWNSYPILSKLAQVIPIDMPEQDFLARCKTLNEILGRIGSGPLKSILHIGGCPSGDINAWRWIKLLQALANLIDDLIERTENAKAFIGCASKIDWVRQNELITPFFILYDLRIADAHESINECIHRLEEIGFDHAQLHGGYGLAFDYILDKVIESLSTLNRKLSEIIANGV